MGSASGAVTATCDSPPLCNRYHQKQKLNQSHHHQVHHLLHHHCPPLHQKCPVRISMGKLMSAGITTVLLLCTLYFTLISTATLHQGGVYYIQGGGAGNRHGNPPPPPRPSNLTQNLPDAIIFGVRKGGTRALLEFLNIHPQIVTAHYEMHFFDKYEQYEHGLEWYRQQMPWSQPGQLTLEKTPAYFINPEAPERILKMNPNVKLLLIIRDPITRLLSDYTQILSSRKSQNLTFKPFEELVIDPLTSGINLGYKAVQISLYHHHFRRWIEKFPRSQIHIVDGDKLILNPAEELSKVEDFLQIKHVLTQDHFYMNKTKGFYCMRKNETFEKCLGSSKGRKHPQISDDLLYQLRRFYAPHNQLFYNLSGRNFDWPER